jgi:Protein of unknown function (DUF3320).
MAKMEYTLAVLDEMKVSSEEMLSGAVSSEIEKRLSYIIECEAPITESVLKKRLLNSFGLKKCGARLQIYLEPFLNALSYPVKENEPERVFYKNSEPYLDYRPTSEDIRYSYQIPYTEGANAIRAIKAANGRMNKKELLNLFAAEFGYRRKGAQVVALFRGSLAVFKN